MMDVKTRLLGRLDALAEVLAARGDAPADLFSSTGGAAPHDDAGLRTQRQVSAGDIIVPRGAFHGQCRYR